MTAKLILGIFVLALAILLGVRQMISNQEMKERTRRGRVSVAIAEAKAKNRHEAALSAPTGYYASVKNLDDALAHYSTLIAEPVVQFSRMDAESKEIETWYKLRVIEFLSQPKAVKCSICSPATLIPSELQPVDSTEIILTRNIGTITSDGVTVTVSDANFPGFEQSKKYLLFVLLDPATRVAAVDLGPGGVNVVEETGQISPVSSTATALNRELTSRYGDINRARAELRFRRFPE